MVTTRFVMRNMRRVSPQCTKKIPSLLLKSWVRFATRSACTIIFGDHKYLIARWSYYHHKNSENETTIQAEQRLVITHVKTRKDCANGKFCFVCYPRKQSYPDYWRRQTLDMCTARTYITVDLAFQKLEPVTRCAKKKLARAHTQVRSCIQLSCNIDISDHTNRQETAR